MIIKETWSHDCWGRPESDWEELTEIPPFKTKQEEMEYCKQLNKKYGNSKVTYFVRAEKNENYSGETSNKTTEQNKVWNSLNEEERQNVLTVYSNHPDWEDVISALETKFGKHNLQPEPKIKTFKTWKDIISNEEDEDFDAMSTIYFELEELMMNRGFEDKIKGKILACYQISKLIEITYGGMITEEEWVDGNVEKASVIYEPFKKKFYIIYNSYRKEFITFHSKQQAEEFMSYPENVELVEQYYMI